MKIGFRLSCAGLAAMVLLAVPAAAKECREDTISATSREYISRSLGAFPGSWAAWRKEVKARLGDGWQAWRRSKDRNIKCHQAENSSGRQRWTCTRTARPCRPGTSNDGGSGNGGVIVDPPTDGYPPISKVLRRGMKNEDQVKTLQFLLREAGYKVGIDGDFGPGTETALKNFQKKSGIAVDGRAGPRTVEALTS